MGISTSLRNSIVCLTVLFFTKLYAQDIHFSQFNQSPLTLNPALAGTTVWIRAGMIYRTQWSAVTIPYKTIGASFDIKLKKRWEKSKNQTGSKESGSNGFGCGINIYNDRGGDGRMGTLQVNGSLAYQIKLSEKSMFALGFQGGIMQRSIRFDNLYWGTQYDPTSSTGYNTGLPSDIAVAGGNSSFIVPDISVGGIYSYKKNERHMRGGDQMDFTVGTALFRVIRPAYSFLGSSERIYQRQVIHGTGNIGIPNSNMAIVPGFMISKQGPNQEIFAGSMIRYTLREDSKYTGFIKGASLSAGGYYRNKDAVVIIALFEFSSYGLGVSYDFNVSGLKTVSSGRGGFEVTLRFLNPAPFIFSQASFSK